MSMENYYIKYMVTIVKNLWFIFYYYNENIFQFDSSTTIKNNNAMMMSGKQAKLFSSPFRYQFSTRFTYKCSAS